MPKNPDDVNINPQSVTLSPPILPQTAPKSKDRPPDILDNIDSDSDNDSDINTVHTNKNDEKTKKVTFQDT